MRRGVNVQNHPFVDRILSFGMMDTFIEDETLYQRSLNCNGCCLCWIRCCISMSCCCCDGGSDDSVPDSDEEKYAEFAVRRSNESGTMSYRNACDYVLNCREVI